MKKYAILLVILLAGCISIEKKIETENPKYFFVSFYSLENISIKGKAPQYKLPLNLENISNKDIILYFNLTQEQIELLKKNGFVVIGYKKIDDVVEFYKELRRKGIPLFITSDVVAHLYHVQFNDLLRKIEEREIFGMILNLSKFLFEKSKEDYNIFQEKLLKEAARRNVAYFAVALKLLGENIEVPDYVNDEVENELQNIENHEYKESSIFHYKEDYSQYIPRGHYTKSEKLKKYFKAMMWYGRMAFLIKGGEPHCQQCPFLISEEDSNIATLQAVLISIEMKDVFDIWKKIYSIISFFVGVADDLTPYEYIECLEDMNIFQLVNETNLIKFKAELAKIRSPKIYGGTGNVIITPPITKEKLYEAIEKTKGMRFIGQRYTPDAYIFQQLISPAVGMYIGNEENKPFTMEITLAGPARCFPRGLDVMAALGSERALEILEEEGDTEYEGKNTSYYKQLEMLRNQFNSFNVTQWNRNLYWSWLFSLKALIKKFDNKYPTFMQSKAWLDKELQTSLASWTQLRHDTILYAKQSYTPIFLGIPPAVKGYVEPVVEYYARMKALVNMTIFGLKNFSVINETEENKLKLMEEILENLLKISLKEINGENLSKEEENFISSFPEHIEKIASNESVILVADVHTDANTMQCLEEAIGYLDLILVAYKMDKIYIGAGATLSYYEFKQPITNRLNDEEWKENIERFQRPAWISSFFIPR